MHLFFVERGLDLNNFFTPEQRLATELLDRSCSVLASAGSGKTKTLVGRYIALLKKGISPRNILTVTFTTDAAHQLRERVIEEAKISKISVQLQEEIEFSSKIGTLHSFCFKFLQQYGSERGLPLISEIISDFDLKSSFNSFYRVWVEGLPPESLKELLNHFSHRELESLAFAILRQRHLFFSCLSLAQEAQAPDPGAKVISFLGTALKPLCDKINNHFQDQGKYTFDDLEYYTAEILSSSALVRTRLRTDIKHILVDEFQDTSPAQWQILRLLWGERTNGLFIVGDPKQSIYRFRAAEPLLFEQATELIKTLGGTRILLDKNFRTQPELIDQINQLSSFLFQASGFFWNPMVPGKPESDQSLEAKASGFRKHIFGEPEKTLRAKVNEIEVNEVTRTLQTLIRTEKHPFSVALLFRNADRIKEFSEALARAQVPHQCQKTQNLSQRLEALELVSFLKLVLDPTDDVSLVGFLRSSYLKFSYEKILEVSRKRKPSAQGKLSPLIEALKETHAESLSWFFMLLEKENPTVQECFAELFLNTRHFPESHETFLAFINCLGSQGQTLQDLQAKLDAFKDSDVLVSLPSENQNSSPSIQLMTVHASKGLEFDHVFLVDTARTLPHDLPPLLLQRGLPPGIQFWENNEKIQSASFMSLLEEKKKKESEEARRIFYVALTRARASVTAFLPHEEALSYPENSWAAFIQEGEEKSNLLNSSPSGNSTTDLETDSNRTQ